MCTYIETQRRCAHILKHKEDVQKHCRNPVTCSKNVILHFMHPEIRKYFAQLELQKIKKDKKR